MSHPAVVPITIASVTSITSLLGQLNTNTTITVGEALTVFVFVGSLVAWLSRKLQKIEDDIQESKRELADLRKTVASRPCQGPGNCNVER